MKIICLKSILATLFISLLSFCSEAQSYLTTDSVPHSDIPKVGLVLSGGTARGIAHIGVLKVMEECGIVPDYITGTSMGAIIGGLYALGYSADEIEKMVYEMDWIKMFSDEISYKEIDVFWKQEYPELPLKLTFNLWEMPSLPKGVIQGQHVLSTLQQLTWRSNLYESFDQFPIPFKCVAADIVSGDPVFFASGNLALAIRSSMSLPSIFAPVKMDGKILVDGGVLCNYPILKCKEMGAEILIGSLTGYEGDKNPNNIKTFVDILTRSAILHSIKEAKNQIPLLDVNIVPDVTTISAENFLKAPELIKIGEAAARDPLIYAQLQEIGRKQSHRKIEDQKYKNTPIRVDEIQIVGTKKISLNTLESLCDLKPGMEVTDTLLNKAVNKLYHLLRFKLVYYNFSLQNEKQILIFNFIDKDDHQIELGLNYTTYEGPGLMVRAKFWDLLLPSSLLKINVGISSTPKILLNYEILPSKGRKMSFYVDLFLNRAKLPYVFRNENNDIFTLGYFYSNNFNIKFGSRIRLWDAGTVDMSIGRNYYGVSFKEGMQYLFEIDKLKYSAFFAVIHFKINTLDNPYFPRKGTWISTYIKQVVGAKMSKDLDVEHPGGLSPLNLMAKLDIEHYFKIHRFTIAPSISIGIHSHTPFLTERFIIGGLELQNRVNGVSMSGITQGHILSNSYAKAGLNFQYVIYNNIFLQTGADGFLFFDKSTTTFPEDYDDFIFLTGWNLGVGVTTPIGPLKLSYSRLIGFNEHSWTLNAGFPF